MSLAASRPRAAAFFDRDGTLTVDDGYTHRAEDLRWLPGAVEAIRLCNEAGRLVVVVTNQSGVARGLYDEAAVHVFHAAMQQSLSDIGGRIDAFYHCPFHHEGAVARYVVAGHPERKPRPGMLRRACLELGISAQRSFLIGDRDADLAAADAVGMPSALVSPGEIRPATQALLARTASLVPEDSHAAFADRARRARRWLFDHALPIWWEKGFDRDTGQFFERLHMDGTPAPAPRRIRVQARQTAVYAMAGRMGWPGPWRDAVEAGVAVLLDKGLHPDGGSRHLLDDAGQVTDARRDLYDLAFIIFALAEAARALGDRPDLLAVADAQVDWLITHWATEGGGYLEGEVAPVPPRRQNPHMHLFEALLALYESGGAAAHLERAGEIAALFAEKLFDRGRGMMGEYFAADWSAAPGEEGQVCEPGHQFEWSWLLLRFRALGGADLSELAEALRVNGEVLGVDPVSGITWDEILLNGAARKTSSRLWPHTERLKAHAARYRLTSDPVAAAAAVNAVDVLFRYCDAPLQGLWRDRLDAAGAFVDEPAPASSFYHIMVALKELMESDPSGGR